MRSACHTVRVTKRAAIFLLATVVSFLATQPVPARAQSNSETAAIHWLADTRTRQSIRLEVKTPHIRAPQRPRIADTASNIQYFTAHAIQPRAPPLSLAS